MTRKNNPKQTVENIISISAKLFVEKGYDKTSMQDIVNALGMSKGAIFYHFNSKESIFNAVMERQIEQIVETVNQWLVETNSLTAREKLKSIITRNLTALTDETIIKESSNMVSSAKESSQITLATIQGIVKKLAPIIANVMKEGVDDGSIITEFPDECAEVLLLLLNFWCDTDVFHGDLSKIRKRFQFLQHVMKQMGVDIIEDETIELITNFYEKQLI